MKFSELALVNFFFPSQVSALLGRIPSAVGYQPTLATDMGGMQERITTTRKGSITSVQVKIKMTPFHLHSKDFLNFTMLHKYKNN